MTTHETAAALGAALLIDVSLRAVVLVALAALVCYLLRRSSAAARHAAWALTLAALLCLPLLRAFVPPLAAPAPPLPFARSLADGGMGWDAGVSTGDRPAGGGPAPRGTSAPERVPSGAASSHPAAASSAPRPLSTGPLVLNGAAPQAGRPAASPENPYPSGPTASLSIPLALLVWIAGVTALMARTILGLAAARRLVRRCVPVAPSVAEATDGARRALGVSRPVLVLAGGPSAPVAVPMTCGFLRPAILLPADAAAWPADRLRAVLLHEVAHVRRGDWPQLVLAQCACALYWFHPLVWLAAARLRAEGEGACDDLVLSCGVAAPDYAAHLLEIVQGLSGARRSWPSTVAMARRADIADRLRAILGEPRSRRAVTGRVLAISAVLAAGLTVSLAALRPTAVLSPVPAVPAASQAGANALLPAAVLASGAPTQGAFTLADITRNAQKGFVTPPTGILPPHSLVMVPVMAGGDGTGLWIRVRGGIGFQTLTVPLDGGRHAFPFGRETLTVEGRSGSYTYGWTGPGGVRNFSDADQPYGVWSSGTSGSPAQTLLTLVPRHLSRQFRVTAQPLSATGAPLSRPVDLVCQAAAPNVLFVQIPTGYDKATRQMLVTAGRAGAPGGASWRLTDLPASVPGVKGSLSPTVAAGHGFLALQAAAAESQDLSGDPDFLNRHPSRPAGDGWFFGQPLNADGHGWTGVPTVRLMLRARNTSPDFARDIWMVRLNAMTPQWRTSPVTPSPRAIMPLNVFPVYSYQKNGRPVGQWEQYDWQVGVAYPGQQHWVRVDGDFVRFAYRTEKVTFHDATVVQDGPSGVNRLVWPEPETQTTPSGISVTVLNRRPGAGGAKGNQNWRYEGGNVPLLLAWHLPAGCAPAEHASLDASLQADTPQAAGAPESASGDVIPAPDWAALAIPGQADARALARGGYMPLCLAAAVAPPPSAPVDEGGGASYVPPPSPPHSLKTVTLTIRVREQQEVHPFHLLLPVAAKFPSGWDPDSADGRSSAP